MARRLYPARSRLSIGDSPSMLGLASARGPCIIVSVVQRTARDTVGTPAKPKGQWGIKG